MRLYNSYKTNWVLSLQGTTAGSATQCEALSSSSNQLYFFLFELVNIEHNILFRFYLVPNGLNYNIKSASTGLYLEISGSSAENQAQLSLASSLTQAKNQQFSIFDPCGSGNYVIQNANSLLALEANCGKPTSNGCGVDQYAYVASAVHMRWTFA